MKVNPITNTNFKGLFTDRTAENNGNWRMEYRPYSWELKKAKKEQVDVYASYLPRNEEIYIDEPNLKISKDILGTKSYIKDTRNGRDILRIQIEDMPSMNYETSLKVKDKKLAAFLEMKKEEMNRLKESLIGRKNIMFDLSQRHESYVADVRRSIGLHTYDKIERANGLSKIFDKMTVFAEEIGNSFEQYIRLTDSFNAVNNQRNKINEELEKIETAKQKGLLVDISRRDIKNPNKSFIQAFENIESAKNKLFVLSNKTIKGSEIIKTIGNDFSVEKAVAFIEHLMKDSAIRI